METNLERIHCMSDKSNSLETLLGEVARAERRAAEPGRRRFFVNALASGVAVATSSAWSQSATSTSEQATTPPPAGGGRLTIGEGGRGPSRIHPSFVKDVGLMTDLNSTNQGGAWWNFDTYITPIPEFYIRNAFPTPRPD